MRALSIHIETNRGPDDVDGIYSESDLRKIIGFLDEQMRSDRIQDYSMDEYPERVTFQEFRDRVMGLLS